MNNYKTLALTIENNIAHIQLCTPASYNAMTLDFWQELPSMLATLDQEGDVRVVLISGQGKHFTAGMELSVFDTLLTVNDVEIGRSRAQLREKVRLLQATFDAIENLRMPVIAAVQGACIGGGVGLISACDIRYCTEDAFFSVEETNIGITCDIGSLQRLRHLLSETHLREWVYSGDRLPAAKALQYGLVSALYVDQATMLNAAMAMAAKIAQRSPLVLHGCKTSMNFNRDHSVREGLDHIALWNAAMLHEKDVFESLTARSEKRLPIYASLVNRGDVWRAEE